MELSIDNIDLLAVALDYRGLGFSVIPLGTDKQPAFGLLPRVDGSPTWNPYRERMADDSEFHAWFGAGTDTQIGILCGKPSNNLFVFDFDVDGYFDKFRDALKELAPDLHDKFKRSVISLTRKGVHVAVRCDSAVPGNEKLALIPRWNDVTNKSEDFAAIESRGEGGYVVAAPSPPYAIASGSYASIVTLTISELEEAIGIVRSLGELPISAPPIEPPSALKGQNKPGDWYNNVADETVLLESGGWTLVGSHGDKSYWRRPGKDIGVSATFNHAGNNALFVFSSNAAPFEGQRSYSKFAIRTMLEFGGDWAACAAQCSRERGNDAICSSVSQWEPVTDLGVVMLPRFPLDIFPSDVRGFVGSVAESIQVPVDAVALSVLGVFSAVASRSVIVTLSETYSESLNNYYGTVLPPGARKSALHRLTVGPLIALDREQSLEDEARMKAHKKDVLRLRKEIADLEKRAGGGEIEADEKLSELEMDLEHMTSHPPKRKCLLVDDCTPEELVSIMADSDETVALMSAEGGVFGMMAGRYNGAPNLDVYLKGHACDFLRVNRRSGDPITLFNPTLTMSLCLQPEVLTALEAKQALTGRGLTARFIWSVPENLVGTRKVDTPDVPAILRASYERDIRLIASWAPPRTADGQVQRYSLRESPAAKSVRLDFAAEIERRLHPSKGDLNTIADWTGKLVGHMIRTAGLLHLMEHVQETQPWSMPITAETMTAAVRFARYCIPHSLAAHRQLRVDIVDERAQKIADWIRDRNTADRSKVTVRDATRAFNWGSKEAVTAPLAILVDHGYIRPKGSKRGKDVTQYEVNPHVLAEGTSALCVDDVDAIPVECQDQIAEAPEVFKKLDLLLDGGFISHLDELEAQWHLPVAA